MEVDGTEIFVEQDDNAAIDTKLGKPSNKAKNPSSWMGSRVLKMLRVMGSSLPPFGTT